MRPLLPVLLIVALAAGTLPARADIMTVTIESLVFTPAEISVKQGDTIEWVNKDPFVHTATVKGGWEVIIPAGKSASRVMSMVGAVAYFCRFHPNMKGRITVLALAKG